VQSKKNLTIDDIVRRCADALRRLPTTNERSVVIAKLKRKLRESGKEGLRGDSEV